MRNVSTILLLYAAIFLTGCKNEPDIVSMEVDIAYKNANGMDLLNPYSQDHFSSDSIHVYNLVNGVKKERYYSNLDNPKLWSIFKIDSLNTYYLGIGVEVDTTLIMLNKSIMDTLICSIDCSNNNHIITNVWYNGILKWNNNNVARQFIIIK